LGVLKAEGGAVGSYTEVMENAEEDRTGHGWEEGPSVRAGPEV